MKIKHHKGRAGARPVGLEIKIARIRKGLRQWELASRVGICQNSLSLIEVGRKRARPDILERIWRALGED